MKIKNSATVLIIPPTVIAGAISTAVGVIVGASSAATMSRTWFTDALQGAGIGFIVIYLFCILIWLRWAEPREMPVVVRLDQPEQKRELLRPDGNQLVRDFESITNDQARLIAYHVKRGGSLSHNRLAQYLTPKEIAAFQQELKDRNMAIDRRSDPQGGIELTDKGHRELARYHSPTGSYEEWKNAILA